jgi:hypothetical protein
MGDVTDSNGLAYRTEPPKKQILLNAFDMSTVGHLSPGQWKVCGIIPGDSICFLRRDGIVFGKRLHVPSLMML